MAGHFCFCLITRLSPFYHRMACHSYLITSLYVPLSPMYRYSFVSVICLCLYICGVSFGGNLSHVCVSSCGWSFLLRHLIRVSSWCGHFLLVILRCDYSWLASLYVPLPPLPLLLLLLEGTCAQHCQTHLILC